MSHARSLEHLTQSLCALGIKLWDILYIMQVITPVRRSARKTASGTALAAMLHETEFAYAPNEALALPRHPMFESSTPAEPSPAQDQQTDEAASTPSSVTGVDLAGELSISAASPSMEEEMSFATYSSGSRLSSQSPALQTQSPLVCTTPPETVMFSLQTGELPAAGAAGPGMQNEEADLGNTAFGASVDGDAVLTEATNTASSASFITPPRCAMSKTSPQGPVTRSKSARKVSTHDMADLMPASQRVPVAHTSYSKSSEIPLLLCCLATSSQQ